MLTPASKLLKRKYPNFKTENRDSYLVADCRPTADLLNERNSTHGSFIVNSRVSQSIKDTIRNEPSYNQLQPIHKEALDFIAGKIGRIMAGQPTFDDHWDDIAGYAQLPKKFNHGQCTTDTSFL